jgi:hypothetical protein
LKKQERLGEIFQYQPSLSELAARLEREAPNRRVN